jgi:hypothetical protein
MRLVAAAVAALALAQADVDESQFRYTRTLSAPRGVPVRFEPDARMYGHARTDFPDLRILDASGEQVPWRPAPKPAAVPKESVPLVARGSREGTVTVVLDRGAVRPVIDRIELDVPDRVFVGEAVVQGSNTGAEGSYARLSTTPIYAVRGAVAARSTTAVFPATDYRYLLVQAKGVSQITGASVSRDPERPPLEPVEARTRRRERERTTVVRLDFGFANVPVDSLRIQARTPRYVRQMTVEGSNEGKRFTPLGSGEIARFPGVDLSTVAVFARHRYLRLTIQNGDDAPLAALTVTPEAQPRPLLLAEGYRPPFRLLYGGPGVSAPAYDFAQLPPAATGFESARDAKLGAERASELFEAPVAADTRTFFERNDRLIEGALVLAAFVVATGGFLALRRRTEVDRR